MTLSREKRTPNSLRGEVDQVARGGGLVAGQGGAGADAAVAARLEVQLGPQAPEQAGHVAALGAVVGVQLVEDDVAHGVGAGVLPQLAVLGTEHEEVEHLVVGQQDVRRVLAEDFPVGDDVVGPHRPVAALAADVQPRRHPALEPGLVPDLLRQPAGLVAGQGVHRVEDDGLDARPPGVAVAVVEQRVEEALRLARAGAGGDQGVLRLVVVLAGQPLEGGDLVDVGDERRGDVEDLAGLARPGPAEGQLQTEVRPLEDALLRVGQEALEGLGHRPVLEGEGGVEVVEQGGPQLVRNDAGDHGASSWLRSRSWKARYACRMSASRSHFVKGGG